MVIIKATLTEYIRSNTNNLFMNIFDAHSLRFKYRVLCDRQKIQVVILLMN